MPMLHEQEDIDAVDITVFIRITGIWRRRLCKANRTACDNQDKNGGVQRPHGYSPFDADAHCSEEEAWWRLPPACRERDTITHCILIVTLSALALMIVPPRIRWPSFHLSNYCGASLGCFQSIPCHGRSNMAWLFSSVSS